MHFSEEKGITRKLKWNSKKNLCSFVEHEILLRLIYVSTVLVGPFDPNIRYREPHFFPFSVNKNFSMKKVEKSSWLLPHFVLDFTCVR